MNDQTTRIRSLRLRSEVFIWRQGVVWVFALTLLVIAGCLLLAEYFVVQPQRLMSTQTLDELTTSREELRKANSVSAQREPDSFMSAQASLRAVMVDREELPEIIRKLHEATKRHRIDVQRSDYQLNEKGRDDWLQQTVTLPMRVGYAQFKPFLFDVLRTNPAMAVDHISIKRETVAQATPEIVLHLSVWVDAKRDVRP